jgi:cell division protein FtsB
LIGCAPLYVCVFAALLTPLSLSISFPSPSFARSLCACLTALLACLAYRKIGGSNFFWSFPAKQARDAQVKLDSAQEQVLTLQARLLESEQKLTAARKGRESGKNDDDEDDDDDDDDNGAADQREEKLAKLAALNPERKKMEAELEKLKENDPQVLEDLKTELRMVRDGANRWTDNIFACRTYLKTKKGMQGKEADKMIGK